MNLYQTAESLHIFNLIFMNIDTLRLFCDVVHYQSFSKAAVANKISQSAATQAIHRMESDMQITLLDRSTRPMKPTAEGEICAAGFHEIVDMFDSIIMRVQTFQGRMSGQIRVAAIYSVGLHMMSRCMSDFMKTYPKVKVRLEFQHPHTVYQSVRTGETDLGIVSYPVTSSDIEVTPLRSESMVFVCPPTYPLPGQQEKISFSDLQDVNFIGFDQGLPIRKEIDKMLQKSHTHVNYVMEFDNIETIKQAVESGLGVSILPTSTIRVEVKSKLIRSIPLDDPPLFRPIGIIHKAKKPLSLIVKTFIEYLISLQEEQK